MKYIVERLSEPSTWRGLILILTSFGIGVSPDLVAPIIAAGTGIAGLVGVVSSDR